mmetsp:Transcript_11353/g.19129  ORF Transcript_11353/g.19129 Transcript_11353/m.19129 type:complete len:123 (+) Transcript_11353:1818-2186(+)
MNDLQDMRGFDPNQSLAMDQSIMGFDPNQGHQKLQDNVPFNADESMVASAYNKAPTMTQRQTIQGVPNNFVGGAMTQRSQTIAQKGSMEQFTSQMQREPGSSPNKDLMQNLINARQSVQSQE